MGNSSTRKIMYSEGFEAKTDEIASMTHIKDEILKHFIKETLIVWCDPNMNLKQTHIFLQQLSTISDIKFFAKWQEAINYLNDTQVPFCQVITSISNSESILKQISYYVKNIPSVHVFVNKGSPGNKWANLALSCRHSSSQKTVARLANQSGKPLFFYSEFPKLRMNILNNVTTWERQFSFYRMSLPAFSEPFSENTNTEENYAHLHLKAFIYFQNRRTAKKDFISLAKKLFYETDYANIKDFENNYNDYNMENILKWYAKECFLYKVVNTCLKNNSSMQYCRLVLRDLEQAIKEKSRQQTGAYNGLLFRGAYITNEEWITLGRSIGKDIEILGFLSAFKKKEAALNFLKNDMDKKALITIIVPSLPHQEEQGFVEMKEYSEFKHEEEILFNMMSTFTVLQRNVEETNEERYRSLVLLYGAQALRIYTTLHNPDVKICLKSTAKCQICRTSASEDKSLVFVNLCKLDEYCCFKCLQQYLIDNKTPLLCVQPSACAGNVELKVEGFVIRYQAGSDIVFCGFRCEKCKKEKLKSYFRCLKCKGNNKIYCDKCLAENNECIQNGHLVVLESHPFSFWSEKTIEKQSIDFSHQIKGLEDEMDISFEQTQILRNNVNKGLKDYREEIDYYQELLDKQGKDSDEIKALLYHNTGNSYRCMGQYQKAIELYSKSLEIQKEIIGENHPSRATAITYSDLGAAYNSHGENQKAVECYLKALEIQKISLGNNDIETANSYSNIGNIYRQLGEFKKSLEFCSKALDIKKSLLGENHLETATSYSNLGVAYNDLGAFTKAIELYSKALDTRKKNLGNSHPSVASCYNNLGGAYNDLGKHQEAIEFSQKGLEIRQIVLGDNHPDTAESYDNMGTIYYDLGEYEKAVKFFAKALKIRETVFGDKHLNTATSYNNMGFGYRSLGEYKKAVEYYGKAISIKESLLGKDNLDTAISYNNIGIVYSYLGEYEKGKQFCTRALDIREKVLGEDHRDVANSYNNIASIYVRLGEYQKGIECYLKSLRIMEKVLGNQHLKTAALYKNLGSAYNNAGEYWKAIEHYSKALEIMKGGLGDNHPSVASCYNNLGSAYNDMREYQKAVEFSMKALEIREKVLGGKHPDTAISYNNAGMAYGNLKDYRKAAEFYLKALEIQKAGLRDKDMNTATYYYNLAVIYRCLGDHKKWDKYSAIALEIKKAVSYMDWRRGERK